VGLKLIFLIVTRAVSLLGLSRREWWWKDAEILMLRHQLAVAQRERPRAHSRLTWPDRAWLALLAGTVPAERLAAMRLIVTPGTILRWQRDIVRRRWARLSRRGRSGRPATHRKVRSVVLRLARENESWGYRRIHGELAGLGITVAPSTVWQILKDAGISPAPRRDGPGWAEFLRSQAQGILALDFFTADLLNGTKACVLAVIEHGTRRVRVLGATGHPVQSWVVQQARNLLMDLEDAGVSVKFVLHDRDASFTAAFDAVFQAAGTRVVRSAIQAPRMNSVMERWIGSCRRELLDRTLIWNHRHLMTVLREYEDLQDGLRGEVPLLRAFSAQPSSEPSGHPFDALGSPVTYAVFATGFAWMWSWHGAQTMRVLRRIFAMRAAYAGWPGPGLPRLASPATWWTATVALCSHSSHSPGRLLAPHTRLTDSRRPVILVSEVIPDGTSVQA
jgi:putative transposase